MYKYICMHVHIYLFCISENYIYKKYFKNIFFINCFTEDLFKFQDILLHWRQIYCLSVTTEKLAVNCSIRLLPRWNRKVFNRTFFIHKRTTKNIFNSVAVSRHTHSISNPQPPLLMICLSTPGGGGIHYLILFGIIGPIAARLVTAVFNVEVESSSAAILLYVATLKEH